jgi:hypothetical protein
VERCERVCCHVLFDEVVGLFALELDVKSA